MAQFQALREAGYGTAFSNNYLEQGRYAEACRRPATKAERGDDARGAVLGLAALSGEGSPPPARRSSTSTGRRPRPVDAGARLRMLVNDGGSFRDVSAAGPAGADAAGALVAAVAGDYDNDERTDLFVLGGAARAAAPERRGTFEDMTKAAGIPAPAGSPGRPRSSTSTTTATSTSSSAAPRRPAAQQRQRHVHRRDGGVGLARRRTGDRDRADRLRQPPRRRPADRARHRRAGAVQEHARRHVRRRRRRRRPGGAGRRAGPDHRGRRRRREQGRLHRLLLRPRGAASVLAASDGRGRFTAAPRGLAARRGAVRRLDNDGLLDVVAATSAGLLQVRNLGSSGPTAGARAGVDGAAARAGRGRDARAPATSTGTGTPTWWCARPAVPSAGGWSR